MTDSNAAPAEGFSSFIPTFVLALALLATLVFQSVILVQERANLELTLQNQQEPVEQARKIRDQLQNILGKTAKLAQGGNTNAQAVIDELERRGVKVNADGGSNEEL